MSGGRAGWRCPRPTVAAPTREAADRLTVAAGTVAAELAALPVDCRSLLLGNLVEELAHKYICHAAAPPGCMRRVLDVLQDCM